ncbi:type II toxin-antitoxin system RelE/ParE family toxin [Vitellibacter sp. q18]|nr:type II toxin-antitoxin system RelE/ParE family toxin [Aequorivita lutea]
MEGNVKHVRLTNRALKDIVKIRKFNNELYGEKIANDIVDNLFEYLEILENPEYDFAKIGAIDEAFSHRKQNYRKLIVNTVKITYRVGKTKIYVVRIFDTRQNPAKNI